MTTSARRTRKDSRPQSIRAPGEPGRIAPRSMSVWGHRSRTSNMKRAPRSLRDQPTGQRRERVDRGSDDHVGRPSTDRCEHHDDREAGHVDHPTPGVAAVREGPQVDEPNAAEPLVPHERPATELDLATGPVAEARGEDRGLAALADDRPGQGVVARPGRPIRGHRVVVEDPDPARGQPPRPSIREAQASVRPATASTSASAT